ncbi:MAG: hypothetical protein ACRED2_06445, partial [Methylocella sp.]
MCTAICGRLSPRALVLDLVELGEKREHDRACCFGVGSAGSFFPMANADAVERPILLIFDKQSNIR